MTDSLDDFFAKKDKKRSKDKGKSGVLSAESLVRELEEGSKQADYPVRKENKTSTAIELLGLDANDADWRDFEDVEKRDYTGLKVKEMSLQDQNEEEQRRLSSEQTDLLPESTAWRMKDETAPPTVEPTSNAKQGAKTQASDQPKSDTEQVSSSTSRTEEESGSSNNVGSEKKGDKESAKPAAYVPPQARSLDTKILEPIRMSKNPSSNRLGGRQGPIPNLQDEQLFPSLG